MDIVNRSNFTQHASEFARDVLLPLALATRMPHRELERMISRAFYCAIPEFIKNEIEANVFLNDVRIQEYFAAAVAAMPRWMKYWDESVVLVNDTNIKSVLPLIALYGLQKLIEEGRAVLENVTKNDFVMYAIKKTTTKKQSPYTKKDAHEVVIYHFTCKNMSGTLVDSDIILPTKEMLSAEQFHGHLPAITDGSETVKVALPVGTLVVRWWYEVRDGKRAKWPYHHNIVQVGPHGLEKPSAWIANSATQELVVKIGDLTKVVDWNDENGADVSEEEEIVIKNRV